MANKIHYDLKKAYYAVASIDATTDAVTYGDPVRIPGAVALNLSPEGEVSFIRADGKPYICNRSNNGYKGDMEFTIIPESFEADCLGATKDTTDKTVGESSNDDVKPFALMFEFAGDQRAIKHVMYLCYADRFGIEGDNPDKKDGKTSKVSIVAIPRPDNDMIKYHTDDDTTDSVVSAWYTSVYEPTA